MPFALLLAATGLLTLLRLAPVGGEAVLLVPFPWTDRAQLAVSILAQPDWLLASLSATGGWFVASPASPDASAVRLQAATGALALRALGLAGDCRPTPTRTRDIRRPQPASDPGDPA